jgi:hypothetical protein
MWARRFPPAALAGGALLVLGTLLTLGGLIEARRWALPVEIGRLAAVAVVLVWYAVS